MTTLNAKKNLIGSDMVKLRLGTINDINDEEHYVELEQLLNGVSNKPLAFYGTLSNAINTLMEQGYGSVEIKPTSENMPLVYIKAGKNIEGNNTVNIVTFGAKCPPTKNRPYPIDGIYSWQTGDIVYNTDFLANRCIGWVCSVNGWEMFGDLDISKDKTTFQVIDPGEELPAASAYNLGKFVLYADKPNQMYKLWYCTQDFLQNNKGNYFLQYKWVNLNDNNSPIKSANIIYNYEGWQVTRIEELEIADNDETYIKELPSYFAIYGRVPELPPDTELDYSEIQSIKIGSKRYALRYSDNQFVWNGEIPVNTNIIINIDTANKRAWLTYAKPTVVELQIYDILPQPTEKDLGKRILYQELGVDDYPVLYYCTQITNDRGVTYYQWVQPKQTKLPAQVAEIEYDNGKWKVTKIGEMEVPNDISSILTKISNTLILAGNVPTNSAEEQILTIGDRSFRLKYLDGSYIGENDILVNTVISVQVNFRINAATISANPPPIEFIDKTIAKVTTTSVGNNGRWFISQIGDVDTSALDVGFKTKLPDKVILIVQAPADSVNNQRLQIGGTDYALTYINSVSVMSYEIRKDAILTIHGSLSSNKLYIPAFPSAASQQAADYTALEDKINLEASARQSVQDQLDAYKEEVSQIFQANAQDRTNIRNSINSVVSANFAPLNSPSLTGTPTATTPVEGDSSKKIATTEYVMRAIASLIASSPDALNTLNELAQAINNDPNFATTMTNSLARKIDNTSGTMTGTLTLMNNMEISGDYYNAPALVVGGNLNSPHIEVGPNAIQGKENANSSANLTINATDGLVIIGKGGLQIEGNVYVKGTITCDGEITAPQLNGNATTATTAKNIPTEDVGGNIWIS